jgi:hypothetical protein
MRLSGLTLETAFFEDYLSFLTEVLELELTELTDISMRLDLSSTWLEIKKVVSAPILENILQFGAKVEFALDAREFEAMTQKISFFYYRRGPTRFLFLGNDGDQCKIVDPDGRVWCFQRSFFDTIHPQVLSKSFVRNF